VHEGCGASWAFLVGTACVTLLLLYLSYFFKKNRSEYFDRLQAVRDAGQWEHWLKFFLRGIAEVAEEATMTARKIVQLREQHRKLVAHNLERSAGRALNLLESLYRQPVVTMSRISEAADLLSKELVT
jgi:Fic family protein